jgi:hypothetical protein
MNQIAQDLGRLNTLSIAGIELLRNMALAVGAAATQSAASYPTRPIRVVKSAGVRID